MSPSSAPAPSAQVLPRDQRPPAARIAAGRAARSGRSRESLGTWRPGRRRADPVALLAGQERGRVAALLPLRHARMSTSPFAFYRGSALVMAADLATLPMTGLTVQLCGDAHLGNFGVYAAPDRRLVFDVNDYDETLPGPFEWDVLRLATSFVLAGQEGRSGAEAGRRAAREAAASYRQTMRDSAAATEVALWYARDDEDALLRWATQAPNSRTLRAAVRESAAGARTETVESAVERYTETTGAGGHRRRFRDEPPGMVRLGRTGALARAVLATLGAYRDGLDAERAALLRRYEVVDVGHKIVGVGSVGLTSFLALLRGAHHGDHLLLQLKQCTRSVLAAYLPGPGARGRTEADRIVLGMRYAQPDPDLFLGTADRRGGPSLYVRQFRDLKWAPDTTTMSADQLADYAAICGHALGRSHARTGDAVAIAAYLGRSDAFESAVQSFARGYAAQVHADADAYRRAGASGAIAVAERLPRTALVRGLAAELGA